MEHGPYAPKVWGYLEDSESTCRQRNKKGGEI